MKIILESERGVDTIDEPNYQSMCPPPFIQRAEVDQLAMLIHLRSNHTCPDELPQPIYRTRRFVLKSEIGEDPAVYAEIESGTVELDERLIR